MLKNKISAACPACFDVTTRARTDENAATSYKSLRNRKKNNPRRALTTKSLSKTHKTNEYNHDFTLKMSKYSLLKIKIKI